MNKKYVGVGANQNIGGLYTECKNLLKTLGIPGEATGFKYKNTIKKAILKANYKEFETMFKRKKKIEDRWDEIAWIGIT